MRTMKTWLRNLVFLTFLATSCLAQNDLVHSVLKSEVSPDGDVVNASTDLLINLHVSMDPSVPGKSLAAGREIWITLPPQFTNTGLPMQPFGSPQCNNTVHQCSTVAVLQGWPQSAIADDKYKVVFEDDRTIAITALENLVPLSDQQPGVKQIHLALFGVKNPERAGYYPIRVSAETGPNGKRETGIAWVTIRPSIRPTMNSTSVFNNDSVPPLNSIYQRTTPGTLTPLTFDFLVWDSNGEPMRELSVRPGDTPHEYLLVQWLDEGGFDVVGHIRVEAPEGAEDFRLFMGDNWGVHAPITGRYATYMRVFFKTSAVPGLYKLSLSFLNGNAAETYVSTDPNVEFPGIGNNVKRSD